MEDGDTLGAIGAAERYAAAELGQPRQVIHVGDDGKLSLTKQTYMGQYASIEIWAMSEFGGEAHEGKFYPSIYGARAKRIYDYFMAGMERVILANVAPGGGLDSITDITGSLFGKMPKDSESKLGLMNKLEMEWRPYWTSTDPDIHGPQEFFWKTIRDVAMWLDIWKPAGSRVKALTLPIESVEAPDAEIEKKKKKKKPVDGLIILILLAAVYMTRKKN